eukprot:2178047-Pyramimonas_sp.AAC.1
MATSNKQGDFKASQWSSLQWILPVASKRHNGTTANTHIALMTDPASDEGLVDSQPLNAKLCVCGAHVVFNRMSSHGEPFMFLIPPNTVSLCCVYALQLEGKPPRLLLPPPPHTYSRRVSSNTENLEMNDRTIRIYFASIWTNQRAHLNISNIGG